MSILNLDIQGIRSFKNKTHLDFAIPDKEQEGSGLNMFVGPNNSGKSSIIEALYLINNKSEIIPNPIRNQAQNNIEISLVTNTPNITITARNTSINSAFIEYSILDKNKNNITNYKPFAYILSSKRSIVDNFNNSSLNRENFLYNNGGQDYRKDNLSNNIGGRFTDIIKFNKKIFDFELEYILGYLPQWSVDSNDGNNLFIAFKDGNIAYSNSGSGDGFINLFIILTALYDAPPDSTIIIDEPEVALHPDVQQRLMERLIYHSKDKQIIISTHSPYFINLELLNSKAKLFRFSKTNGISNVYSINTENIPHINKLYNTTEQPYLQDTKSREIFFFDKLILVEGIDDISGYKTLFNKYNYQTSGHFYGWGLGGADRINHLLPLLNDLNYQKIVVILDGNKDSLAKQLHKEYPNYLILQIPTDDIRCKEPPYISKIKKVIAQIEEKKQSPEIFSIFEEFITLYSSENSVQGLFVDRKHAEIDAKYDKDIKSMIRSISEYFEDNINSKNKKEIYSRLKQEHNNYIANKMLSEYINNNPHIFSSYINLIYPNIAFVDRGGTNNLDSNTDTIYNYQVINSASTQDNKTVTIETLVKINILDSSISSQAPRVIRDDLSK